VAHDRIERHGLDDDVVQVQHARPKVPQRVSVGESGVQQHHVRVQQPWMRPRGARPVALGMYIVRRLVRPLVVSVQRQIGGQTQRQSAATHDRGRGRPRPARASDVVRAPRQAGVTREVEERRNVSGQWFWDALKTAHARHSLFFGSFRFVPVFFLGDEV